LQDLTEVRQIKNRVTGEVCGVFNRDLPNYFDPDKGYRFLARKKHVRTFPGMSFPVELNFTDKGRLLELAQSMWANTGVVGKLTGRSFRPYSDAELLAAVDFSDRRGREWLERMVRLSMLRSVDVNMPDGSQERQWYVNPLHFCPMFITRQSYLIWRDQIDEFFPEWVVKEFGIKTRYVRKKAKKGSGES
jgi:hypothetical protein